MAGREIVVCPLLFVAVNNGGGGIFDHLPQATLPEFEQGWRTPQQISFEHVAAAFGLTYQRAASAATFRQALQAAFTGGPHLIEVVIA